MNQYKPELGRFYGDSNPKVWVFQAERYFNFYGFSKDSWLSMPYVYFKGEARAWFDWLYRNNQFYDWEHFKEKLAIHYRNFENSVEHPKVMLQENGAEILRQLAELRDAFSTYATQLAAHELSDVKLCMDDQRDSDSTVPVSSPTMDGSTSMEVVDSISQHSTESEGLVFDELPQQCCYSKEEFAHEQSVATNIPSVIGTDLDDEQLAEDSVVDVVLMGNSIYEICTAFESMEDKSEALLSHDGCVKNIVVKVFDRSTQHNEPPDKVLDLDVLDSLSGLVFNEVSHQVYYSRVFAKMSIRKALAEIWPHQNILWLQHALGSNSWVDTGQAEITLMPWDFGRNINTQFSGIDPTISIVEQSSFMKESSKEDRILVFRKLKEYYGMSFPFDPGALLKHDQFRSSWLKNERGVFDDIIDSNLVVVFDKNCEHTGKSVLADALFIMHCKDIQTKANLLRELHIEQYLLFGCDILIDDRSGLALAMDRFDARLQEFQVKKIERMHKVLEFVNNIHGLCAILGIDFLSIATKIYPRMHDLTGVNSRQLATNEADKKKKIAGSLTISHPMRFSDINEVFMQASGIRNILAIVYEFVFHSKLGDYSCFLDIQLLDRYMSSKEVNHEHTILMFVQELKIKAFALDQLYGGDFSISRDSMVLAKCLDLLVLSGLLYVHIKGHVEYLPSSYIIEVWDPGRKWCAHSYMLQCDFALTVATALSSNYSSKHLEMNTQNKERKMKKRLICAISLDGIVQSLGLLLPLSLFGWL